MEVWKRILASAASVVGISIAGGATFGVSQAFAYTQAQIEEAERACVDALEQDTPEALQAFLEKYGDVSTACTALALDAIENKDKGGNDGGPGNGYRQ